MVAAWIGDGRLVADVLDGLEHAGVESQVGEGDLGLGRLRTVGHATTVGPSGGSDPDSGSREPVR